MEWKSSTLILPYSFALGFKREENIGLRDEIMIGLRLSLFNIFIWGFLRGKKTKTTLFTLYHPLIRHCTVSGY